MSLNKQLWLGIIAMLLLALGGSFVISLINAKAYLEEQLQLKNIDNAATLALSITQLEKDPVTLELLISAQLDTGHYQRITLTNPDNEMIIERVFDQKIKPEVPAWFSLLTTLNPAPGVAQIQDGWQQFGTLTVESHSRFAVQSLWKNAKALLGWFLIAALIGGIVGSQILTVISRPLKAVIQQAEAIGERRFVRSPEPKTLEFQRLVRAMNRLSDNVKNLLEEQTRQLAVLQDESQRDPVTGLSNRAHFLNWFDSQLHREDSDRQGVIALARVGNLAELNHHIGHAAVDQALKIIAKVLQRFVVYYPNSQGGRLNGSDFSLVVAGDMDVDLLATELARHFDETFEEHHLQNVSLPLALYAYSVDEKREQIMAKLDGALAQAELKGKRALVALKNTAATEQRNAHEWRALLENALHQDAIELASFAVKTAQGVTLHQEAPLRLQLNNQWQPAGYFIPWATRLGLMPEIDLLVVRAAVDKLASGSTSLAINISAASLCSAHFREQAIALIHESAHTADQLWFDFPESCALHHMAELRVFSAELRKLGCYTGLKHVGLEFSRIRGLEDLGLQYLKIDNALIRDIQNHSGNQQVLQNLRLIAHSLGYLIIAEGVESAEEQHMLFKLGMDGVTGPVV